MNLLRNPFCLFVLPDSHDAPAGLGERFGIALVPLARRGQLRAPPFPIRDRSSGVFRTRVPVTAIYEEGQSLGREDYVRCTRKTADRPNVFPEAQTSSMQGGSHRNLGSGIAGTVGLHTPPHPRRGRPGMTGGARHNTPAWYRPPWLIGPSLSVRPVYERRLEPVTRRVSIDDLVDAAGVASALGLTHRNSVATYMRRYGDFPHPLIEAAGGRCRLWSRADINRWIAARQSAGRVRAT